MAKFPLSVSLTAHCRPDSLIEIKCGELHSSLTLLDETVKKSLAKVANKNQIQNKNNMRNIATNLQAKRRTIEISRIGETARARREAQREASEKDTGARSGGDITEDTHGGAQIDDSSAQVGEHKNTGAGLRADTGKNDPQHEVELGSFSVSLSTPAEAKGEITSRSSGGC